MTKFLVSLLVLLGLAFAGPASAHDELVSVEPTAGSTHEAGVIPIRLTFGEAPMDLPFGQGPPTSSFPLMGNTKCSGGLSLKMVTF
jgi:hypothetical protein